MKQLSFEAQVMNGFKEIDTFFSAFFDSFTAANNLSNVQIKAILEVYLRKDISMKDLCNRLGMSKSNLSPVCKKLEGANLLKKTRDYHDQRIVNLTLTDEGLKVVQELHARVTEYANPYLKKMTEEEKEVVLKGFAYLGKAFDR